MKDLRITVKIPKGEVPKFIDSETIIGPIKVPEDYEWEVVSSCLIDPSKHPEFAALAIQDMIRFTFDVNSTVEVDFQKKTLWQRLRAWLRI